MIKLVVFDWNGTLLADTQAIVEGVARELKALGRPPITIQKYREHYDVPIMKFYKNLGIDEAEMRAKSAEVSAAFHSYYEARVAHARTRTGTRQLLTEIARRKTSQVILSNHTMEGIYLQLERLKLTSYFDAVLANENTQIAYSTGKEGRLKNYIQQHSIPPAQVAIVGDTVEEIRIGQNLELKTIAITGGHNSTKRLKAAKPDVLVHSLHEIIQKLEEF